MNDVLTGLPVVLGVAAGAFLGLVFLAASLAKLTDSARFRATLAAYRLLPETAVGIVALLLPVAELAVGAAMILGLRIAFLPAAGLFLLFAGAVAINIRRGRSHIDCGCGGHEDAQPLSWELVAHDVVLAAVALAALALPAGAEPAVAVFAIAGALVAGLLFFLLDRAFGRMIAIHARYRHARGAPAAWTRL